jgi:hypothetical protein
MLGQQVRCPLCDRIFQVSVPAPPPPHTVQQQVPAPTAAAPPQDSEFAFDQLTGRSGAPRGPEQEFNFDAAQGGLEGVRSRTSVRRGAAAMRLAFVFDLLTYVFFLLLQIFAPTPVQTKVITVVIVTVLFLVPVAFIQVGSVQLNAGRGQGLAVTGCIMALLVSLELLIYSGFLGMLVLAAIGSDESAMPSAASRHLFFVFTFVIWCFAAFLLSLLGGIRGLIALGRRVPQSDSH